MRGNEFKAMRRRRLLSASALAPLAALLPGALAHADEPALPELAYASPKVRVPSGVFLASGTSAGPRLLAGGEQGVIIYSDDQGKSWTQASVPVSVTITSLGFVTPQVGWATGGFGVILNTQDGGKSWVKQMDGLAAIQLMQAATQAFAASKPAGDDSAAHAMRRSQILAQQGPDKPFLAVLPVSVQEAFIFGAYRMALHTTDGGKSWQDWSFHIGDPLSHNIYAAAAINGAYYLSGETGLVFASTDGGQNFVQLTSPGDVTLFGIGDAGGGAMITYGVAGQIFRSTDNGKSWTQINFPSSSNITAVVRLSSGLLLAGDESGNLFVSKDQGQSFTQAPQSPKIMICDIVPVAGDSVSLLTAIGVIPMDMQGA